MAMQIIDPFSATGVMGIMEFTFFCESFHTPLSSGSTSTAEGFLVWWSDGGLHS
jgi:hypothetical protein